MPATERVGLLQSCRLALIDLRHDRLVSLCQITLVAALFTPLLLLFALKYGIVSTLLDELAKNPETLRLRPVGSYHLGPDFFAGLQRRPDVGFVVPATRSIAAQIYLSRADAERPELVDLQMLPTGAGDPLGEGRLLAAAPDHVGLSQAAARQLEAAPGDRLIGRIERMRNGRPEVATVPLTVTAIVPERLHGQASAFVDPSLLIASERFRDDYAVPQFGTAGERPWATMQDFASFRLYARDLRDVAGLAAHLRELGIEVKTEAEQIEGVLSLDRNLDILFVAIAAVASLGLVGALMASMVASVDRKRKSMAVLGLLGFGRRAIALFPLAQAWVIALVASLASIVLALAGAAAVNVYFAPALRAGQVAARLRVDHIALGVLAVVLLTTLPASVAAWRVSRIEPAEALREI